MRQPVEEFVDNYVDNLLPEDFYIDCDCHAGPEDGCSCPNCLSKEDCYITHEEMEDE